MKNRKSSVKWYRGLCIPFILTFAILLFVGILSPKAVKADDSVLAVNVSISEGNGLYITWSGTCLEGANYTIYLYYAVEGGDYSCLLQSRGSGYTYRASSDTVYSFYAVAKGYYYTNVNESFEYVSETCQMCYLSAPAISSCSCVKDDDMGNGIKLTWDAVANAESYNVYRRTSGEDYSLVGSTTDTTYFDSDVEYGVTYFYCVRAVYGGCEGPASSEGFSVLDLDATKLSAANGIDGINLKWDRVDDADGYNIYTFDGSNYLDTTLVTCIDDGDVTEYTDTSVSAGELVYYIVKPTYGDFETYHNVLVSIRRLTQPAGLKAELLDEGIKITFNEVTDAEKYLLYLKRSSQSEWTLLTELTETEYLYGSTLFSSGEEYSFKVVAGSDTNNIYKSAESDTVSLTVSLVKPVVCTQFNDGYLYVYWNGDYKADTFELYRSADGKNYELLQQEFSFGYKDYDVESANTYSYYVVAKSCYGVGDSTSDVYEVKYYDLPVVDAYNSKDGVYVYWNSAKGASGYNLYRTVSGFTLEECIGTFTDTCYLDKDVYSDVRFDYRVVLLDEDGEEVTGCNSIYWLTYIETTSISVEKKDTNTVHIKWGEVLGVDKYVIYRKTNNGSYKIIATTSETEYTDSDIVSGNIYSYYVKGYDSECDEYSAASNESSISFFASSSKMSQVQNLEKGIKLTWTKDSNATGYVIYKSVNGGAYKAIKTITKNSTVAWTDTSVYNGSKYTYKIRPYKTVNDKKYYASAKNTLTMYRLNMVTVKSAKNVKTNKLTVTWNKNSKASGYQIVLKIGSEKVKSLTITGNANVTKTIAKLTKGKTYKIYVRSFKTVGSKKYYSKFSSVRSVKINK